MADLESRPAAAAAVAAVVVTAAVAAAAGLAGQPAAQSVVMAVLVCLLLAVTGQFIRVGLQNRDRTRLLLAQLQDTREAGAATAAERSRVAGELHDGLAHSLAGLAIQLQGARKHAGRETAGEALRAAIDRSAELAQAGLTGARQAVSARPGEQLPASAQPDARAEDRPGPSGTPASAAWGPRFSDTAPPAAGECF